MFPSEYGNDINAVISLVQPNYGAIFVARFTKKNKIHLMDLEELSAILRRLECRRVRAVVLQIFSVPPVPPTLRAPVNKTRNVFSNTF